MLPILTDIVSIKYPYKKMPVFKTAYNKTESGVITAAAGRSFPLYLFEFDINSEDQNIERFNNFYCGMLGGAFPFLFKDFEDYNTENENIGNGGGSEKLFQLKKKYFYPYNSVQDSYFAPDKKNIISGSVKIYLNGVSVNEENYSVNYETGIITFEQAPVSGAAITADFGFYYKVRFNEESFLFERERYKYAAGKIVLMECL